MWLRLPVFSDEGVELDQVVVLPVQALPKGSWWLTEAKESETNGHSTDPPDHPDHRRHNRRSDVHLRPEVTTEHHHHCTDGRWPEIICCEEDHP